jgi:hypothetical protein
MTELDTDTKMALMKIWQQCARDAREVSMDPDSDLTERVRLACVKVARAYEELILAVDQDLV